MMRAYPAALTSCPSAAAARQARITRAPGGADLLTRPRARHTGSRARYVSILHGHRLAELTSLALHREVARRLRDHPSHVGRALERVRSSGNPSSRARWEALLGGQLDALCELLGADTEEARDLRQTTPFAGVLDGPTRMRIWWSVRS